MQRRDELYLADIVEAAQAIREFLTRSEAAAKEDFVKDDLVRSAVLQKLTVIGEAAARVSEETAAEYPEVPWRQARGMRNLLVHAYFSVDWDIVWTTATESVPRLEAQIAEVLESSRKEG
jgi:uncharacterized protein with HEPN domain